MTLTIEYLNLVFIGYFLLLIFTGHATLIAKHFCGDEKTYRRRKKNFLWGWVIIITTIGFTLIPMFLLGKNNYTPNLKNDLFFALLPLLASCIVMLYWRYHGPVITFSEDKPEIQECKFLFTFSKHYDIKYDTFYLSYRKNDHFISEKFERAYFQIRFDCLTLDQLYLYFMPFFQKLESKYAGTQEYIGNFSYYVQKEVMTIVNEVINRNLTTMHDDDFNNPDPILKIIESELTEQIMLQYGINPIIEGISFYGVGLTYSIRGLVTKDGN